MAKTQIEPTKPRIQTLLNDVENGNIKIPVFQRDYVWDDEQIISLLDSIYRGYPVGSVLLWSTKERLKFERDVGGFILPDTPEDYPVRYVLDGQQRLTTLYAVFHSADEAKDEALRRRFEVLFVPSEDRFVHSSELGEARGIYLRDVLDATKLFGELDSFSDPEKQSIIGLQERFKDYEFPVVTIKERPKREVCQIFQRINSSGTSLSTMELLSAWTWSEKFDLRRRIEELRDTLSDKNYAEIDERQILRCLSGVMNGNVDTDALVDADPDELVKTMGLVETGTKGAVDFLRAEFRIKNIIFVPFPLMMVPLIAFFAQERNPIAKQRQILRQWFWHASFTQRFKAGTTTAVVADLGFMKKLAEDPDSVSAPTATVSSELFLKTWRINSTAAKAAICLMATLEPRSLLSGTPIDLDSVLEAYNARQFHHIYPKAYLSSKFAVPFHEANLIANICMLTAADNNQISDRAPSVYSKEIDSSLKDDVFRRALLNSSDFRSSTKYKDFVRARAQRLRDLAQAKIDNG